MYFQRKRLPRFYSASRSVSRLFLWEMAQNLSVVTWNKTDTMSVALQFIVIYIYIYSYIYIYISPELGRRKNVDFIVLK